MSWVRRNLFPLLLDCYLAALAAIAWAVLS